MTGNEWINPLLKCVTDCNHRSSAVFSRRVRQRCEGEPFRRNIVRKQVRQVSLVICLFLFLLVVVGGGLHLNPGGAFLAAVTGTPLIINVFNRRSRESSVQDPCTRSEPSPSLRRLVKAEGGDACHFEGKDVIRQ